MISLNNRLRKGKVVVVDIETTGLSCGEEGKESSRIIEIAAVKYEKRHPAEQFHTYIHDIIKTGSTKTECREVREQTNGIGQGCSTMPLKNDIVLFCLNGGEIRCERQPNRKRRERRERL